MTYRLLYTRSAVKDIQNFDIVVRKKLKKKIEKFIQDPISHAKKLVHSDLGEYRWRVGNYRVVFDIQGEDVVILRIGHRREIYR